MVSGTDNHSRVLGDGRRALTCHPSEPRAEFLQKSQAKGRFGEPEMSVSRFLDGGPFWRRYLRREIQ